MAGACRTDANHPIQRGAGMENLSFQVLTGPLARPGRNVPRESWTSERDPRFPDTGRAGITLERAGCQPGSAADIYPARAMDAP